MKIKIIEAASELGLGGTEYVIQLYSKYLNKNQFDVLVVGLNAGGERVKLIEQLGVRVQVLDGDLLQLAVLLRETDVFHWHGAGTMDPLLLRTIWANKPRMVIQTNIFGLYHHSNQYDAIDYDLYVSKMILIRRMQEDRYLRNKFEYKRKVLYNPVDVDAMDQMCPSEAQVQDFKEREEINGYFIVGRIGRADDHKFDPITLIGFAEFAKKVKNARFLLVGVTPNMLNFAWQLEILDKLIIFDNTPDMAQLLLFYRSMDVFLAASSMGESFGLVIAEAMHSGLPVVTISTPDRDNAQIELVDNEKTGLVVERHVNKISDALSFLYQNEKIRKAYGAAAKEKVRREYRAQDIVASLENLIYSHLQLPHQHSAKSSVSDFSVQALYDYMNRCKNIWPTPTE